MLGVGDLRVLIYEVPDNPQKSLAFEEAMWRSLMAGIAPDTLRIWGIETR
jgi:lipoate-protein ligase A